MRPRRQKDLRFAVDLTNFYYHRDPEHRLALRRVHQSIEMTAIAGIWLCTHVFTRDGFDINGLVETVENVAYELFYDEFTEEYELNESETEQAIMAVTGMAMDVYPVVTNYAQYLLDDGKSWDWIIESIDAVEWHVPDNEDKQDDEDETIFIHAPVLEYHHFT